MNFFLKISNETRSGSTLKVDSASGARFIYTWDPALRAYTYQPKNQDEVDDFFATMGRTTSYQFCPVNKAAGPATPVHSAVIQESKPVQDPLKSEAALLSGILVNEDDTNEIIDRLLAAYQKGANATLQTFAEAKPRGKKPA